MHTWQLSTVAR